MGKLIRVTDLNALTVCNRRVYLDYHGDGRLCVPSMPYQEWIQQQGEDFEAEVVAHYQAQSPRYRAGHLEAGFRATLDMMRSGVKYIYQGVLIDGDLLGIPDLLERVDGGGSRLGGYAYRPIDIKLAGEPKPGHRLQVMAYITLLESIQGVRMDGSLFLRLPAAERAVGQLYREERVVFDGPLFARHLTELRRLFNADFEPLPFISTTCNDCPWRAHCTGLAEQRQDASLISGLQRAVWAALHERGLGTLPAIAASSRERLINIKGIGEKTANRIIWQAQALTENRSIQFAAPELPHSDPAIFFDVESIPSEGVFYLMGTLVRGRGRFKFEYDIAKHPDDERHMWNDFLRRIDRVEGYVYHYGSYERSVVKTLMARYGADDERARRLLARLVDLQRVLKDSVVLPLRSYSLKDVAPWLGFAWQGDIKAADDSILEYMAWLETGRQKHIRNILRYNEDDCRATVWVHDWLLSLPRLI